MLSITEAARLLRVDQKTLRRWSDAGKVPHVRTLGGQRRYEPAVIDRLRREMGFTDAVESSA
jgi:excisionase family DNA binding protein